MSIDCGIIGLPNVGKSTLFNILTNLTVKTANFLFCTIQPNISVVRIPDIRVNQLANIVQSRSIVHSAIRFIDVAGLIKGAAQGIGMGSQILNYLRTTTILCHMVRCFRNKEIVHIFDDIDPCRDVNIVNTEFILFDILQCENSICTLKKKHNTSRKEIEEQLFVLKKCLNYLYDSISLREIPFSKTEKTIIQKFHLLTIKPIIYIANIDLQTIVHDVYLNKLQIFTSEAHAPLISFSAAVSCFSQDRSNNTEMIVQQKKERILYDIINSIFSMLNLCTVFTVNENMIRTWIYSVGTTALEASKQVHSDFKKGFIRAQVINYDDFITYKGELGAKKFGRIRYEGKNYCIEDGDILKFLFHM